VSGHKRSLTLQALLGYWEIRAGSYWTDDVFGRNIIRAYLAKLQPRSLIEIGCGHGELFLIYKDVPNVVGVDWSLKMIERANLRKARHGLTNLRIWRHDITQCSPAGHYDVALTRTVLMHLPPEAMEKTVRHIVKAADQFLILEYFEPNPLRPLSPHCWLHDYARLFEAQGCELVDVYQRPDQPQVLFHFRKKLSGKLIENLKTESERTAN
jgi:SAM-dependent methyltransferase